MKDSWYSAFGLFRDSREDPDFIPQYEERTVVVKSSSREVAEKAILEEFRDYAQDGVEFLGEYIMHEMFDAPGNDVVEVSSLIRVSALEPGKYIKKYWCDLRPQSCTDRGWNHAWCNLDDERSSCYNCRTVVDGQLWKGDAGREPEGTS